MSERPQFPPPPIRSALLSRDGTAALGWLQWFGALATWVQRVRVVAAAADWPSIPAGGAAFVQITVAGARVGDFAMASLDPCDRDLSITAHVSAADTVTIWAENKSASPIDLAAGTTRVRVEKAR